MGILKCNKCKKGFKKGANYCIYCGNKLNINKIIFFEFVEILLYILSFLMLIVSLYAGFYYKSVIAQLLLFISFLFTCPIVYKIIIKYIDIINKTYIRTLAVVFPFIIGIYIISAKGNPQSNLTDNTKVTILEEKEKEQEKKQDEIKESAIKKIDKEYSENDINISIDDKMVKQFMNLGFNIEEATEMQHTFYQMGINSINDIHSGNTNPDINKLVAFVAIANNNDKQKFYFSIENRKMFYAGFTNEDLYDSTKGGVLKNINDIHIPETKVSTTDYSTLQVLAQDEVKKYLNYPNTASFPLYDGWGIGRSDDNYKVIGKVNSKNGFGVESKINFSVWFIKNNNDFTVDAVVIDGIRVK